MKTPYTVQVRLFNHALSLGLGVPGLQRVKAGLELAENVLELEKEFLIGQERFDKNKPSCKCLDALHTAPKGRCRHLAAINAFILTKKEKEGGEP